MRLLHANALELESGGPVDYANGCGAVILYDNAYERFIEEDDKPHSIFSIEGDRLTSSFELLKRYLEEHAYDYHDW